ncbi:alpha/beta fold hydrolase [soil metagenome]
MQKLRMVTFLLLLCTASLVSCVPISAVRSGTAQQLDQATIREAHDQLIGVTGMYSARERVVNFQSQGQKVMGTLTLPEGSDTPYPFVLLLHGFTDTRDIAITGPQDGMFTRTAHTLAEYGIASLRIDFRGSGESEGKWEDTTFTSQIADAIAALDYLTTLPEVDQQRLGLIGISQGGLIAAETAARDHRVQTVVLWSPLANPPDTFKLILGDENVAAGLQSEGKSVHSKLPWGAETDLKTPFFADLYNFDPIAAISRVKQPLLVVVGLQDTIVTPQPHYGQLYLNYHEGRELLVTVNGDHIFDVMANHGPALFDDVIAWSLAWLQETLPPSVTK